MLSVIEVSESAIYLYGILSKDSLVNQESGRLMLVGLANQGAELGGMERRGEGKEYGRIDMRHEKKRYTRG